MSSRNFTEEQLREIIALFQVYGDIVAVSRYGSGHINDTFKVDLSIGGAGVSYVLQRINDGIFTRPDRVMENIARVTNHIRGKFAGAEDATRRTLTVIPARDGQPVARQLPMRMEPFDLAEISPNTKNVDFRKIFVQRTVAGFNIRFWSDAGRFLGRALTRGKRGNRCQRGNKKNVRLDHLTISISPASP